MLRKPQDDVAKKVLRKRFEVEEDGNDHSNAYLWRNKGERVY